MVRDMRFDSEKHPDLYQAESFGRTAAEYARNPRKDQFDDEWACQYATTAAHWARKYLRGRAKREYQRARAAAYRSCGMVRTPYGWE